MKGCNSSGLFGEELLDFIALNALEQYIHILNCKGKILDLVLCTIDVTDLDIYANPLTIVDELHPPLHFEVHCVRPITLSPMNDVRLNFFKADYDKIIAKLQKVSWDEVLPINLSVDLMSNKFQSILLSVIEEYVPKSRPPNHKFPPWFSPGIIRLLKEKHKYRMKVRKFNSNPRDVLTFQLLKSRCHQLQKSAYREYINRLEQTLTSNPKLLWSFIKRKRNGKSTYPAEIKLGADTASGGREICNLFASHFASVYSQNTHRAALSDLSVNGANNGFLGSISFTRDQVLRVLKRLDLNKGAGDDGIPSIFVVRCADVLAYPLSLIFNKSLSSGIFPSIWKTSLVLPLHKAGHTDRADNYRPISILPTKPRSSSRCCVL